MAQIDWDLFDERLKEIAAKAPAPDGDPNVITEPTNWSPVYETTSDKFQAFLSDKIEAELAEPEFDSEAFQRALKATPLPTTEPKVKPEERVRLRKALNLSESKAAGLCGMNPSSFRFAEGGGKLTGDASVLVSNYARFLTLAQKLAADQE